MAQIVDGAELSALLGTQSERVSVGGRDLSLRPLNLAQVADALEVVARLSSRGAAVSSLLAGGTFDPVQALLRGGRDVLDLLAIAASDQTRYLADVHAARAEALAFVSGLDAAEGAKLLGAAYAVNRDFFDRNREVMLPALAPAIGDAASLVNAITARLLGLLSRLVSSSSSQEGTDSPKSEAIPSSNSTAS